jgi:hypothetical protein
MRISPRVPHPRRLHGHGISRSRDGMTTLSPWDGEILAWMLTISLLTDPFLSSVLCVEAQPR